MGAHKAKLEKSIMYLCNSHGRAEMGEPADAGAPLDEEGEIAMAAWVLE